MKAFCGVSVDFLHLSVFELKGVKVRENAIFYNMEFDGFLNFSSESFQVYVTEYSLSLTIFKTKEVQLGETSVSCDKRIFIFYLILIRVFLIIS